MNSYYSTVILWRIDSHQVAPHFWLTHINAYSGSRVNTGHTQISSEPRMNAKNYSPSISTADEFGSFLRTVLDHPLLNAIEERELAEKAHAGDLKAIDRLVLANMRNVVLIARRYKGYGLPLPDLIQEGSVGLIQAIRRFDPNLGIRLISYALHWIRAEMHEYILRNFRIVRSATTHAQRKLFFNFRKLRGDSRWMTITEATSIADQLQVSREEVQKAELVFNSTDQSFGNGDDGLGPESWLTADNSDPAKIVEQIDWQSVTVPLMHQALHNLDHRSQDVVQKRILCNGKPPTLTDLGSTYGISAERVRQIEQSALNFMHRQIEPSIRSAAHSYH